MVNRPPNKIIKPSGLSSFPRSEQSLVKILGPYFSIGPKYLVIFIIYCGKLNKFVRKVRAGEVEWEDFFGFCIVFNNAPSRVQWAEKTFPNHFVRLYRYIYCTTWSTGISRWPEEYCSEWRTVVPKEILIQLDKILKLCKSEFLRALNSFFQLFELQVLISTSEGGGAKLEIFKFFE